MPGSSSKPSRIRRGLIFSGESFVMWTAHLVGKAWLPHTDWDELLQKAGEVAGMRIRATVRPTLHR